MREAHDLMIAALIARAGGETVTAVATEARGWASATFDGQRALITVHGSETALARICDGLDEAEFAIPGHLVADIAVTARDGGRAAIAVLTIVEDAPLRNAHARVTFIAA